MTKVAIGCDHGGFVLKDAVVDELKKLGAEVVCVIGHKVVLYRLSRKENIKHIEF